MAQIQLVTHHRVGLATASLSIREDGRTVSLQRTIDQLMHAARLEYFGLPRLLTQHRIELKLLWAGTRHAQDDVGVVLDCDDGLVVTLLLVWLHRAYTDCDLDPLAAQALRVIRVETLCAVERWVLEQLIVL